MEKHQNPYSHTQQTKVWENTKKLHIRKSKNMGFSPAFTRFQSPDLFHAVPAGGLCASDRPTRTDSTTVIRHVGDLMADFL
jgi:hypothetical protein